MCVPCVYPVPNNVCTDLLNRVILGHPNHIRQRCTAWGMTPRLFTLQGRHCSTIICLELQASDWRVCLVVSVSLHSPPGGGPGGSGSPIHTYRVTD